MAESEQVSKVGFKWARLMIIFVLLLAAFGTWAFYDAAIKYPARGRDFAQWAQWQYLRSLDDQSRTQRDPGILSRNAPITDPVAEWKRLSNDPAARSANAVANARYNWLNALSVLGDLKPENTDFDELAPRQQLARLEQDWSNKSSPSPLHSFDVPTQWLMAIAGYGLALYILFLLIRVSMTRYRWDPQRKALTLPKGVTITPDDLEEVDKRKWHKFIVFLKIKPGVDAIGGKSIKVDLYRHANVEQWILEMEAEAFPSQQDDDTPASEENQTTNDPVAEPVDEQG